jgi:3-deoxy-D-manno-octulosonic-acid transferase
MLLALYKTLMAASTPVLEAYLRKREKRGREDAARAGERRGQAGRLRGTAPLIWFHAASVGESLALLAIITRILQDYPGAEALVTTGTVTSAKLMAERLPPRAFHQYMPVDHPKWVKSFIDHWHPEAVVWSESELWPNILAEVKRRGIPAVLLNARMSESSFRQWKWAKGAAKDVLSVFSLCLGQNVAEADRLVQLGARDVRVSSNLKYAAAPLPFAPEKLYALKDAIHGRPMMLFASTHPGEEEVALSAHAALKHRIPGLLTIIVPRHPPRGNDVLALAQKSGATAVLRSTGALPDSIHEVYIADTLGELGLFFRLCNIVVMGGSFAPIGGHNPIEPAQLGCAIFYGPHMHNFTTINEDFLRAKAAVQVQTEEELHQKLGAALQSPELFAPMGDAARQMTEEKSHVTGEIAGLLKPVLDAALKGRLAA